DDHGCDEVGKLLTGTVDSRVPVSRCNAVISWQNRRATLAANCRKGRGEIRWTATDNLKFSGWHGGCGTRRATRIVLGGANNKGASSLGPQSSSSKWSGLPAVRRRSSRRRCRKRVVETCQQVAVAVLAVACEVALEVGQALDEVAQAFVGDDVRA